MKSSYKNRAMHRHNLNKDIIHPLFHSISYSNIFFDKFWLDNIIYMISFYFFSSLNLLSFYDVSLSLNLIFFDFMFIFIFIILFSFYIYNIVWAPSYLYNSDYLWRCFREEQRLSFGSWNWMKDQATLDILNFYTKQLSNVDYLTENNDIVKRKTTYEQLAKEFMKFNGQKDKYLNVISDFKNNVSNIKNKKNNHINQMFKFLNLITKLNRIKTKMNVKFSSSLLDDLTTSITFDYIDLYMIRIILIIIRLF